MKTETKPKANIKNLENQFSAFEADIKGLSLDEMSKAPKKETEPQYKISQQEINESEVYIKPINIIASKEPFNEKFRDAWDFDNRWVKVIAQHNEIKDEILEFWTKPYPGIPAYFWKVPTGKPVYVKRYVAEQIKRKSYHRLKMESKQIGNDTQGSYFGSMAASHTINRIDCNPASEKKSLFFSADDFKPLEK